jgi:hypothetical protein
LSTSQKPKAKSGGWPASSIALIAFADTPQPKPGQPPQVVSWDKACQETLPDHRWANDPKIPRKGTHAKAA